MAHTHTVSVHFFLDTPTVRPLLPVVFVCCPLTRRLERGGKGGGRKGGEKGGGRVNFIIVVSLLI